jgi:hypothetical protein
MRDRHFPRVCGSCQAAMARQQDACWRCGTEWATEEQPRTSLRVISGGAGEPAADAASPAIAASANGSVRAAAEAQLAGGRWSDEGGHL